MTMQMRSLTLCLRKTAFELKSLRRSPSMTTTSRLRASRKRKLSSRVRSKAALFWCLRRCPSWRVSLS